MASHGTNIQNKVNKHSYFWSESLSNVKIIDNDFIIGTTNSEVYLKEVLDCYCRSLPCDFVKSHPSNLKQKRERNSNSVRLLWKMGDIPYDGIPFCVTSHDVLKCKFSMSNSSKRKKDENTEDMEREETVDKKQLSNSLCPAKIIIKKLKRYPSFSLPLEATKIDKQEKLKQLKQILDENQNIDEEEIYWLSIPLADYHNHDFRGKDRSVCKDISVFIKQMVNKGIHSPKKLKSLIDNHVNEIFKNNSNPPLLEDEAYYPTEQNIRFIVYNTIKRNANCEVEQLCLPESITNCSNKNSHSLNEDNKTSSWKPNSLQDVVDAFCRSPLKDEHTSTFIPPPAHPTVLSLREKISYEFARIIEVVNKTENVNKLEYIVSCLQTLDIFEDSYESVLDNGDNKASTNIQEFSVSPSTFTNS